jgi:O-antigen/teichoic acid export membrane protein
LVLTIRTLTSGSLLARNTMLNLIGQVVPLLIGVATIPFVIRGLGTDRFGLLSLAWVVLGYFTVFDLGLGKATTKFVSEALVKGDQDRVPRVVWTAVTAEALLGIAGAVVLAVITPLLVGRVLNVPRELFAEAKTTFYLLALSIPVVLTSSSFRGVLASTQRFDLVNAVKIPTSCATYLLPLVGLALGFNLPGIVVLILLARVGGLAAYVTLNLRAIPVLKNYLASLAFFRRLFVFGSWVTVSNVLISIFVYLDRFLIGSLLTLNAVAYYTAPYEVIIRVTIFASSTAMVLFPTFSALTSSGDKNRITASVTRSIKYLVTAMVPPTVVFLLFGEVFMRIWLGTDFARESTTVFRVLSIGVFLNSIGYIPFSLIEGIGRPDIVAKYHVIELPVYFGVAFLLIRHLGINGAALAFCLRMMWTIPIFFVLCAKIAGVRMKALAENGTIRCLVVSFCFLMISIAFVLWGNWEAIITGIFAAIVIMSYPLIVWRFTFDRVDKDFTRKLIGQALGSRGGN